MSRKRSSVSSTPTISPERNSNGPRLESATSRWAPNLGRAAPRGGRFSTNSSNDCNQLSSSPKSSTYSGGTAPSAACAAGSATIGLAHPASIANGAVAARSDSNQSVGAPWCIRTRLHDFRFDRGPAWTISRRERLGSSNLVGVTKIRAPDFPGKLTRVCINSLRGVGLVPGPWGGPHCFLPPT